MNASFFPKVIARFLPLITVLFLLSADNIKTGKLIISVEGLKSDKGKVRISIHNSEKSFPGKYKLAVEKTSVDIRGGKAEAFFENLPYGEYAAAIIHDENSNGTLDTNLIGIPKEGYGASNNPAPRMGPPLYKEAKFTFDDTTITSGSLKILIKTIY